MGKIKQHWNKDQKTRNCSSNNS